MGTTGGKDERTQTLENVSTRLQRIAELAKTRTTLCQVFGISRQTAYKWVKRYKQDRSLDHAKLVLWRPPTWTVAMGNKRKAVLLLSGSRTRATSEDRSKFIVRKPDKAFCPKTGQTARGIPSWRVSAMSPV
jgi:transposase-like protein